MVCLLCYGRSLSTLILSKWLFLQSNPELIFLSFHEWWWWSSMFTLTHKSLRTQSKVNLKFSVTDHVVDFSLSSEFEGHHSLLLLVLLSQPKMGITRPNIKVSQSIKRSDPSIWMHARLYFTPGQHMNQRRNITYVISAVDSIRNWIYQNPIGRKQQQQQKTQQRPSLSCQSNSPNSVWYFNDEKYILRLLEE